MIAPRRRPRRFSHSHSSRSLVPRDPILRNTRLQRDDPSLRYSIRRYVPRDPYTHAYLHGSVRVFVWLIPLLVIIPLLAFLAERLAALAEALQRFAVAMVDALISFGVIALILIVILAVLMLLTRD